MQANVLKEAKTSKGNLKVVRVAEGYQLELEDVAIRFFTHYGESFKAFESIVSWDNI